MLTGYDTVCMQQHRNKLYRVRFYEVAYRRVCYSAVYNGGWFYELFGGGCFIERAVSEGLRWIFPPVLRNSTQKTTSIFLPLLNIFTHSSILCDSIKIVGPVSLISH